MADYFVNENSLIEIADAIRSKTGTTGELQFPDGFIEEINEIETSTTENATLKQKIFSGTVDASGVVNMSVDSGQKIVSAYLNGATEALNILCVINVENECMAGAWTSSGIPTTSSSAAILSSDGRYLTWIVDPGASAYVDTAVTGVIYYI